MAKNDIQEVTVSNVDSIAIVGLGLRFPGGSSNSEKLWKACAEKKDCWTEIPKNRYNVDGFYHPDSDHKGSHNLRGGYFLEEDISAFDASFFGITPAEATAMDPQQRLLLECAYEALENAGIPMSKISGTRTGVYVGSFNRDYRDETLRDPEQMPTYHVTGTEQSVLANRISHFFNLHGPSISLDTACSASLTALHLGCQSIRAGESTHAIIGGSNLILNPNISMSLGMLRFTSADGRSFAFDSRANGYARGEGVACLVLKPMKAALADGDSIRAVIRYSGANQDGHTPSLTVPSGAAHESLIREVYEKAGLDPKHTAYVEAHGTGTPVGDPIEAKALYCAFVEGRDRGLPLYMGSIKTQVGHLEGASGLAGIIKTVLMLEKGMILPNMNFEHANKNVMLERWGLSIPQTVIPWPKSEIRRASVNSFGFGGANAHIILDGFPDSPKSGCSSSTHGSIFLISAHDKDSLSVYRKALVQYIDTWTDAEAASKLRSLAFTLSERRSLFSFRQAVSASTKNQLIESLQQGIETLSPMIRNPQIAFVFTGQGAQWYAMGRELFTIYPQYRSSIENLDHELRKLGSSWSLIKELSRDEKTSIVNQPQISQPLCTAVQIALVDLLESFGISPTDVVGHSSGEIAAAYCASAIDAATAIKIAYYRGMAMVELRNLQPALKGAMLAVGASADEIEPELQLLKSGKVVVACINSDTSTTLSGDSSAITEIKSILETKDLFLRQLTVDVAYHSPHMKFIESFYRQLLGNIETKKISNVNFWSSVTGTKLSLEELSADYWVQNLVSKVQFAPTFRSMCMSADAKNDSKVSQTIIEIGPHSALSGAILPMLKTMVDASPKHHYIPSLVRKQDAVYSVQIMAGSLVARGHKVNIRAVNLFENNKVPQVLVDLPSYSWNHQRRYWHSTRISREYLERAEARSELLGVMSTDSTPNEPRWRNIISKSDTPWVAEHVVHSQMIYPGAGYIAMAIEGMKRIAAQRHYSPSTYRLRQIHFIQPLVMTVEGNTEATISFRPHNKGHQSRSGDWEEFQVSSYHSQRGWTKHCYGLISCTSKPKFNAVDGDRIVQSEIQKHKERVDFAAANFGENIDCSAFYHKLFTLGFDYGELFSGVTSIRATHGSSISEITIPEDSPATSGSTRGTYVIQPGTLDSCFQTIFIALYGSVGDITKIMLPQYIEELQISKNFVNKPGTTFQIFTEAAFSGSRRGVASIFSTNEQATEQPLLSIKGLSGTMLSPESDSINTNTQGSQIISKTVWDFDPSLLETFDGLIDRDHLRLDDETDAKNMEILERASFYYIRDALNDLEPKMIHSKADHLSKLLKWMKAEVSNVQEPDLLCDEEKRNLFGKAASIGPEGGTLQIIGSQLASIIRGDVEPFSLMIENNNLHEYYHNKKSKLLANEAVASYIKTLSHKNPTLKILEIGAGTGASTKSVLEALGGIHAHPARFKSYTFTDKGASFLDSARGMFREWGQLVEVKKLNIEVNPSIQGYQLNSFDVIIASNVLHTTSNINSTLHNVKRLLKDGGKLVLSEAVQHLRQIQIIFGTLPEWWDSEEDIRTNGPLLRKDQWAKFLTESGFSGIDLACDNSHDSSKVYQSVMIATSVGDSLAPPEDFDQRTPIDIVFHGFQSKPQLETLEQLLTRSKGHAPTIMPLASCNIKDNYYILLIKELDLSNPTSGFYAGLQALCTMAKGILCVLHTDDNDKAHVEADFMVGFMRTIRTENPTIRVGILRVDGNHEDLDSSSRCLMRILEASVLQSNAVSGTDFEYAVVNSMIMIPRLEWDKQLNDHIRAERGEAVYVRQSFQEGNRPVHLEVETPGSLDSLFFAESLGEGGLLADDYIELEVKAVGVNFRDVMISAGQLDSTSKLGSECSGIVTATGSKVTQFKVGDRVFGLGNEIYSRSLRLPAKGMGIMPDSLSFEEASSIPVIYCTVIHALEDIARIQPGETILIHAGAGGVGQAAIMLCQHLGVETFVTVGSREKKQFLMEKYSIPEDHISFSRDSSFTQSVLHQTQGRGVDVVLNSLAAELLRVSWDCVAMFGRFIEIGKQDIKLNERLEMQNFKKSLTFAYLDLQNHISYRIEEIQRFLTRIVTLFEQGAIKVVQPLNVVKFSEIESAFRLLQNGQQWGKWIAVPSSEDVVNMRIPSLNEARMNPNATYIVTGGFGGLGRAIIRWLASIGSRHFIVPSRSGVTSHEAKALVEEMLGLGVEILADKCDIADSVQLDCLVTKASLTMPPIRGIIQGAMVLKDGLFESLPLENFVKVVQPKVQGTWNLHERLLSSELDFFVILASVTGDIGNRGQSAYAGGSTFQNALSRYRRRLGLPCTCIDLGAIDSIGYVAENEQLGLHLDRVVKRISEQDFITLLKLAIFEQKSQEHTMITGLGQNDQETTVPFWAEDPRFGHLRRSNLQEGSGRGTLTHVEQSVRQLLANCDSMEEALSIVTERLAQKVAAILGLPTEDVRENSTLQEFGLDSLAAIELRGWAHREMSSSVKMFDLQSDLPLKVLAQRILEKSKFASIGTS